MRAFFQRKHVALFFLPLLVALLLTSLLLLPWRDRPEEPMPANLSANDSGLLTDPFLQLPTDTTVRVVWFTEFPGTNHTVTYGENFDRTVPATTTKLSRVREDRGSRVKGQTKENRLFLLPTPRDIWRHEAEVVGLTPGDRLPYRVTSIDDNGETYTSRDFTLAPLPQPGTPLKILLTSDHQQMPMTAANLQKVERTVGRVDAVFFAGDLTNFPDRASEWFDHDRGGAFFPCLQGRARYELEKEGVKTTYKGGELIQHAPLFAAIGNHEVMGRYSPEDTLPDQYNDAIPIAAAEGFYKANASAINPRQDPNLHQAWLKTNAFNTDTYEEIFTMPQSIPGGKKYYATTFGDVRLVSLFITNIWRSPDMKPNVRGRFREREEDFNNPEAWGYGQHIFEPIEAGSPQYEWLQREVNSPEFQQARIKIVMFHHPPHSLGDNIVPAYTDPVQLIDRDEAGNIQAIRYEYPIYRDYIIRDVVPLLEAAGTNLVLYGHSHLWNRFISPNGVHYLETSNVGNTYGAYLGEKKRKAPDGFYETYTVTGDPNGLEPVMPTIAPLEENGQPVPYVSSNDITAFSILDTATGKVTSYGFDTRHPDSEVFRFDEFAIADPRQD